MPTRRGEVRWQGRRAHARKSRLQHRSRPLISPSAVDRLSGGSVRIEVKEGYRFYDVDYERGTIEDVRSGVVDLAVVGARAWDAADVKCFNALVVPFLIDSYALRAARARKLPARRCSKESTLGLVGIAFLPGSCGGRWDSRGRLSDRTTTGVRESGSDQLASPPRRSTLSGPEPKDSGPFRRGSTGSTEPSLASHDQQQPLRQGRPSAYFERRLLTETDDDLQGTVRLSTRSRPNSRTFCRRRSGSIGTVLARVQETKQDSPRRDLPASQLPLVAVSPPISQRCAEPCSPSTTARTRFADGGPDRGDRVPGARRVP